MFNVNCQVAKIYNHLGDGSFSITLKHHLDHVNEVGRYAIPQTGVLDHMRGEKVDEHSHTCIDWSPLTEDIKRPVGSSSCCLNIPAVMDCTLICELKISSFSFNLPLL